MLYVYFVTQPIDIDTEVNCFFAKNSENQSNRYNKFDFVAQNILDRLLY